MRGNIGQKTQTEIRKEARIKNKFNVTKDIGGGVQKTPSAGRVLSAPFGELRNSGSKKITFGKRT